MTTMVETPCHGVLQVSRTEDWRTIYDFWFPAGLARADLDTHQGMLERWFRGGANADLPRFEPAVEAAAAGKLNSWLATPLGRLSLIIVLDQFPRGLFAGTSKAFAFDPQALRIAEEGLRNGHYDALVNPWEKVFFAIPLIHTEGPDHLERAERSVELSEKRLAEGPPHLRPLREFGLSQVRGHRDVVSRFGRHPHRNAILGRTSTPEEADFIEKADFVHNRRPPQLVPSTPPSEVISNRTSSPGTDRRTRSLAQASAVLGIAFSLLVAAAPAPQAHPFAFDTSKMIGFEVLTAEDGAMDAMSMVVVKYDGPIVAPMAANLRSIWDEIRKDPRFETFVLRLNSPGGLDTDGMAVVGVLSEIRQRASLITLVAEHDLCASMCVAIYIQGQERYASPASAWMFHGASTFPGGIPSLTMTMRYFDLFKERNIDAPFIDFLFDHNYVTSPGAYWMSGSELATRSNIITKLLPNWKPADLEPASIGGILGGI